MADIYSNLRKRSQPTWQPNQKQTAAMMVDARNRGWTNQDIEDRFKSMGMDLREMAGYSLPQGSSQQYNVLQQQNQQGTSIADKMRADWSSNPDLLNMGSGIYTSKSKDDDDDDQSWWSNIGNTLGSAGPLGGVKGWLDLGVKGMEAYTGFKKLGLAKDQNRLAREAFNFKKDAWNKDYDARKIAYNTNAQMRNDWKRAQTPGGYTMDTLIV